MKNKLPEKVKWVWNARWSTYGFGDKELFEFTKKDFDQKARGLKEAGINAVITFSFATFGGCHFRWNYIDDWQRLLEMLKNICESSHKYGIKVVEHHSAVHVYQPLNQEEVTQLRTSMRMNPNGVRPENHPGFWKILKDGDREYRGVKFSSMRQIDPLTGQFARAGYMSYMFCHNNPDWQKLYFEHLKDIYACGVDGIMTDDISFVPRNYGCGCIHCREKFNKDTGYEMPRTGIDDKNFYGNLENPANRAWVLWRIDCHKEHQARVFKHFRSLGLELARPIYGSSNSNSRSSRGLGFALDNLDGFYSTVFTEVNHTEPQAHCWLRIGAESKQRSALANRNGVPPMCMFYPKNKEENLFCWAMAKTWGQNYWGSGWNISFKKEIDMVSPTSNFESAHPKLYERPEPISEVAVLFSAHTVWLHKDGDKQSFFGNRSIGMSDLASTDCWAGWCETLMLANIPFDTIGENDLEERRYFDRLRLIVVPNAACLSDKAIKSLKEFVKKGGKLIITHQSGLKDEDGNLRNKYPFTDLIGAEYQETLNESPSWIKTKENELSIKKCNFKKAPVVVFTLQKNVEKWMNLEGREQPAVFHHQYENGSVIAFAGKPGRIVCVNRHKRSQYKRFEKNDKPFAMIDFKRDKNVMNVMEDSVKYLLQPDRQLITKSVPRGFIVGMFGHEDRTVLHITNAAGVLSDSGKTVPIPAPLKFPKADSLPYGAKTMEIKVKREGNRAILHSPEFSGSKELVCRRNGKYLVIEVPSELVRCYSVIEIKE